MKPIVLIHGYSAESDGTEKSDIEGIYGSLPFDLALAYGEANVTEIDLGRYISLEDGVTIDDVSRALDRALHDEEFAHLLRKGFHAIVHSTGALVIRNWVRSFSPRPSPLENLIYLAGAHFGSGWAHIGKEQFAKWGRMIFQRKERGVRILHALEFGSSWTIDLQCHFLERANRMVEKYRIREHIIIGSQADVGWFNVPVRYAKEDGSDGVVRVAAGNVNFNYLQLVPTKEATQLIWTQVKTQHARSRERSGSRPTWYRATNQSRPGENGPPSVPMAVPYGCAHSGEKMGIVTGASTRKQVLRLIDLGLTSNTANWDGRGDMFEVETQKTYDRVYKEQAPSGWKPWSGEPRAQYDGHAQVILRLRDQDGRPVTNFDVFFDSVEGHPDDATTMRELVEHKHINKLSPNIITFYLRTETFDKARKGWVPQIEEVGDCVLDINATEPETEDIRYVPLRIVFASKEWSKYIQSNMTTIIDVTMLRVPSDDVFKMVRH